MWKIYIVYTVFASSVESGSTLQGNYPTREDCTQAAAKLVKYQVFPNGTAKVQSATCIQEKDHGNN